MDVLYHERSQKRNSKRARLNWLSFGMGYQYIHLPGKSINTYGEAFKYRKLTALDFKISLAKGIVLALALNVP